MKSWLKEEKRVLKYSIMKQVIFAILIIAFLVPGKVQAQQIDPTLTAAVVAQTATLNNIHKKRKKYQEEILAAQSLITATMDRVHSVENKMLTYLSNATDAVANLHQLKRAGELIGIHIPANIKKLSNAIGSNIQGTVLATVVSDKIKDIYVEMATLAPFMYQLVSSGSYNVTGKDGNKESHKINLLNASERYYVANQVVSRLDRINTNLIILTWQVKVCSWRDLWFKLDPKGWATIMSGKITAKVLINDWKKICK